MLGKSAKSVDTRLHILSQIKAGNHDFVRQASEEFAITVQAVHRHLNWLQDKGFVTSRGRTKGKKYFLGQNREQLGIYPLDGLDENDVYLHDFVHVFEGVSDNVDEICHYGFTEMLNNASDHSDGTKVVVHATNIGGQIKIVISDDGEGIFERIARLMKLQNPNESLLELSKGKLTTDPASHSGEGIFFTSRVFDVFAIYSGDLILKHDDHLSKELVEEDASLKGTRVSMQIDCDSDKNIGETFDQFSSGPDEYSFERTVIPVRLANIEGGKLVSRSQAKRLMRRVDKFRNVVLDFEEVGFIGQAFADEVFRVYANQHPEININVVNLNEAGTKMMKRAISKRTEY